jgi:DNA-binding protein Fis
MKKEIKKKIEKVELIKLEKNYSAGSTPTYYYNLYLQEIEEPLLLVLEFQLDVNDLNGKTIKYYVNGEGLVSEFEFV